MAVRGLEKFGQWFSDYEESYILIGGAACDLWFDSQGLPFRATKDLDVVLVLEALNPEFCSELVRFVDAGGYGKLGRSDDVNRISLYRFEDPEEEDFPYMLELLSRSPETILPDPDQRIVPIRIEEAESLSAILMDDDYYGFLKEHCTSRDGMRVATADALIPLKAKAWLDLSERKRAGENVRGKDIRKHRNDVFRLAVTLPQQRADFDLPAAVANDLSGFLKSFRPGDAEDWTAIRQSIKPAIGSASDEELFRLVEIYFKLIVSF